MKKILTFFSVTILCLSLWLSVGNGAETTFNLKVKGRNHTFTGNSSPVVINTDSSAKVTTSGDSITIQVNGIGSVHSAAIYKGKWNPANGEFSALWWHQGSPHQTRLVYGAIKDGRIKGVLLYPRVAESLVPGYLELQFTGQQQITLQAVPAVQLGTVQAVSVPVREDCISFNPDRVRVKNINGRWKIVEGSHYILDFADNKSDAAASYKIIRQYGLNQSCFVGRPDPSFRYWLVNGGAPGGSFPGEDCLSLNPAGIEVRKVGNSWKIVEGNRWLLDFGAKSEEAQNAFAIIKKYNFTSHCFIGRPGPTFEYWKK